ncbi:MAG: leucyl aminopeptidase [Chloroflexota bacterium]
MKIKAATGEITRVKADAIVLNYYQGTKKLDGAIAAVNQALGGAIAQLIQQKEIKGKAGEITLVHSLGKLPSPRVVICGMGKKRELTLNKVRGAAADVCRWVRKRGIDSVATVLPSAEGGKAFSTESAAQAVAEGARLGLYSFRKYITRKNGKTAEIKQLRLLTRRGEKLAATRGIERGNIIAEATNFARELVDEPANYMTPTRMAAAAQEMAAARGLEVEVLDREQMQEMGMGSLLGVAQGSQQPPKFIILRYRGSSSAKIDLALVGKGITFDSGGISIKPSENMAEMKGDMAGGAAVMGVLSALARLKPRINVTALVPATENLPSGTALKPGDILKAMNGKTIEVLNTDAEGRLILADALCYAGKIGARAIIDVATLTGACMVALGLITTGVFSNNERLTAKVLNAGKEAGEYLWQMPMFPEYRDMIKGQVTDVKNIGNRWGGAITAAKFLEEFVGKTPWVHLDIAGTARAEKDQGYQVKGATGVPVRTLINLVLDLAK